MYSYGPPHMARQKQDDQLEHTFFIYVRIRDVPLKTRQRRWTIERSGKRGSGISVKSLEHLSETIDDRNGWKERPREIHASSVTWWLLLIHSWLRTGGSMLYPKGYAQNEKPNRIELGVSVSFLRWLLVL